MSHYVQFCDHFCDTFALQVKYELEELVKLVDGSLSEDEQVSELS